MNKSFIIGYLGRDPEIRTFNRQDGSSYNMASFSVGVSRRYKNKQGEYPTDWFSCTANGAQADFISKYFHKGSRIVLAGRMECNKGTDKDGNERDYWNFQVDEVEFGDSKSGNSQNSGGSAPMSNAPGSAPGMAPKAPGQNNSTNPLSGFDPVPEDLPFN